MGRENNVDQAAFYEGYDRRTSEKLPELDKRGLLGTLEGEIARGSNLLRTLGKMIREKVKTIEPEAERENFKTENVKALAVRVVSKMAMAGFNVDLVRPGEKIAVDFTEGNATMTIKKGREDR